MADSMFDGAKAVSAIKRASVSALKPPILVKAVWKSRPLQCSRASQPTFKNPHWELPELQNSVLCIPLTVLSEKEVI